MTQFAERSCILESSPQYLSLRYTRSAVSVQIELQFSLSLFLCLVINPNICTPTWSIQPIYTVTRNGKDETIKAPHEMASSK